jgi:ectoine hydroxylase-related dioxygenase (phytanoyl-CoA dioxygenase family)
VFWVFLKKSKMIKSTFKSYGINQSTAELSEAERVLEELKIYGIATVQNFLPTAFCEKIAAETHRVYELQKKQFGEAELIKINEKNLARMCLTESEAFADLACYQPAMDIVKKILGDYFLLNLQNAVINQPNEEHHQSSWHRDLPYQNFVSSVPLAINAFYCITEFSEKTGGTTFLPFSHQIERLPSLEYVQKHALQPDLAAGSVVFFNSMVFHCAGYNSSTQSRIGVNNMYTTPIIRQQIDLPTALNGKHKERKELSYMLGYETPFPADVQAYRNNRLNRATKSDY